MLVINRDNDPFSFESLLDLPTLSTQPCSAWQALNLEEHNFDGIFKQPDTKAPVLQEIHSDYFHLQTYDAPFPEIESASISAATSSFGDPTTADDTVKQGSVELDEDIWILPDVTRPEISCALTSWDHFLQSSHVEPRSTYLSEAGPAALDAALEQGLRQTGKHIPSKVARPDKLIFALFELGSGRQSGLFQWDSLKQTFGRKSEEFGLLGTSQDIQDAYIGGFIATGNTIKGLLDFIEENAALSRSQHLGIALSSAVSVAIYATTRFLEQERHSAQSLIQLQELFDRPRLLFEALSTLAKIVKSGSNASETVARLTSEAQQLANGAFWFEAILSEVIMRTTSPWVKAIADVVGLSRQVITQSALSDSSGGAVYGSDAILLVSSYVLPSEISHLVTECEASLQLLQAHEPDHPLLTSAEAGRWPSLSWDCSWEAIEELQTRADEYERSLKKAIHNFAEGSPEPAREMEAVENAVVPPMNHQVVEEINGAELVDLYGSTTWKKPLGIQQAIENDKLYLLVSAGLSTDRECSPVLTPPLNEALILSISPLLQAQHRLLSCSVLHLLFKKYAFRSHLQMHHRFQLMADGSFASRLSEALFDPDQSSSEGRRKGQGKTGLRLQTRDTWPPASSELRLVLMGILAESFPSESSAAQPHIIPAKAQYLGASEAISFAIRDLSDEELERCRDVDSIYALDFLRLQYKPPSALLAAVLTLESQRKYDRIFKHLLRLLRMRTVSLSLTRSACGRNSNSRPKSDHRFRIEVQFFISTLAEYSTNVAVRAGWARLEGLVEKVEKCLDRSDFAGAIAISGSVQRLKEIHEEALDGMLRALCLDKKQVQARTVLEDIFGLILRTAAMVRRHDDMVNDYDEKVFMMYKEFQKQVRRFIRYLQAQSDASTWNGSAGNGEAPAFEQLLVRLNMFGYYS